MTKTVACHFVPSVDDAAHELWVTFGDPAEREKGGPELAFVKHQENPLDVALDPALAPIPLIARDMGSQRRDLKVVFDVDRQSVDYRLSWHLAHPDF
jgi:hypothetical protein